MLPTCPYCRAEIESDQLPPRCPSCHAVLIKAAETQKADAPTVKKAELIHWEDRFSLGITEIDTQHQRLCELINDLFRAVRFNAYGENFIPRAILQLREYTIFHFNAEEKIFKQSSYPKSDEHQKKHDEFIHWVQTLENNYKESVIEIKPLLKFLVEWFIDHTQRIDREYVPYLNKK